MFEQTGGVYRVRLDDGRDVTASIRGRLKHSGRRVDRVVIGDRVLLDGPDASLTIEERLPRSTRLIRAGASQKAPKVMAANLDRLIVVVSVARPDPRVEVIDRMLALGEWGDLAGVVVLNKCDLPDTADRADDLHALYEGIGYPVLRTSAEAGSGVDGLRALLCSGSSVLVGPSGVGKSTLIRSVQPNLELRIGDVSRRTGSGRHTTVSSRLIPLECGGLVADTPGFGEAGLWGIDPQDVGGLFLEVAAVVADCRFRECSHMHEPDCAVRSAVDDAAIDPRRYASYRALYEEAEEAAASASNR